MQLSQIWVCVNLPRNQRLMLAFEADSALPGEDWLQILGILSYIDNIDMLLRLMFAWQDSVYLINGAGQRLKVRGKGSI